MTGVPKTVEDWAKQVSDNGISGSVTMIADIGGDRHIRQIGVSDGSVSDFQTKIPIDLIDHLHEILRERDRMVAAALKVSIEIPHAEMQAMHLASLKASCLQIAIDVIRKKYTTGEDHGATKSDGTDEPSSGGDAPSGEAPGASTESAG